MIRHRDHRLHRSQIQLDAAVVPRGISRLQRPVRLRSFVDPEVFLRLLVRRPDGTEAGGLSGHHVDPDPVVHRKAVDARSDKFHHLVLHISVPEDLADDRERDVLRPDALPDAAGEINRDHPGPANVIGPVQQLLHQLRTALAHRHRAQRAVPRMAVGSQHHPSAAGQHFPRVLMNHRLHRGHIDAAVLLRRGQSEDMIVLIDRPAHRAERVVAVRQHIGKREPGQSGRPCRLNDADIGDIMRCQCVETDLQLVHAA